MFERNIWDLDSEWSIYDEDIMNENVAFMEDEDLDIDDDYLLNESTRNQIDNEEYENGEEHQSGDECQSDEDNRSEEEIQPDNNHQSEDAYQNENAYQTDDDDDDDQLSQCSRCSLCSCQEQDAAERSYEEDISYCIYCSNENQDDSDTTQSADEQSTSYNEEQPYPYRDEELDATCEKEQHSSSEEIQQNNEQQKNALGGRLQIYVFPVIPNNAESDGSYYAQEHQYDEQLNSNDEEHKHHSKQPKKHFQMSLPYKASNGITYYRCLCGCSLIFDEDARLFFDMSNKDPSNISECKFHCPCGCDRMFEASAILLNEPYHSFYKITVKKQFLGLCVKDDGSQCNCKECAETLDETKEQKRKRTCPEQEDASCDKEAEH